MNSNKRIFYYDFLRAFAIFAVVLCHVDGMIGYGFNNLKAALPGLFTTIALTGVPIFLMLSGALLFNREYGLNEFYKKRFGRIIYPFIFWMIITIGIGIICFGWSNTDALNEFFGITSHTWYIWNLIGIYLFMPVANSFIKEYEFRGVELFLAIWFVTILFDMFNPYYLQQFKLINFSGFFGYTILGYYIDRKKFPFSDKSMFYIGAVIFILFTAVHMFVMYNEINIYNEYYLNLITIFQSIGVFLSVKYLHEISNRFDKLKSHIIGKAIVSVSICSYGMYFAHYILIKYFEQINIHSLKLLPVLLVFILFTSWLVTYIFSKIPYIQKICGV